MTDPSETRPFIFRWRMPGGKHTTLTCYARTEREAEDAAARAGWPGHDGTHQGAYRAWLKRLILRDDEEPPPQR